MYYSQFYVALWSDKPLCVIWKEKYRYSGESFCSEAKFSEESVTESVTEESVGLASRAGQAIGIT